jgi:hypothetical protein
MDANSVLGCSSNSTIRLKAGCCFVLSIFISLYVSEKKATSEPAIKNEMIKSITARKISTAVAAGGITSNEK